MTEHEAIEAIKRLAEHFGNMATSNEVDCANLTDKIRAYSGDMDSQEFKNLYTDAISAGNRSSTWRNAASQLIFILNKINNPK